MMQDSMLQEEQFTERQAFRSGLALIMYIPLGATVCLMLFACYRQFILHRPFGDHPAPDAVLAMITLLVVLIFYVLLILRLETIIDSTGAGFRWSPFMKKTRWHNWADVEKAEVINYGFVGYGIRLSKHGWVHNVAGKMGLKLTLKNKRSIVIGTQQPEVLISFLAKKGLIPPA